MSEILFYFFIGRAKEIEEKNIKELSYKIDQNYFKSFSPKKFKEFKRLSHGRGVIRKKRKLSPMKENGIEKALDILKGGLTSN